MELSDPRVSVLLGPLAAFLDPSNPESEETPNMSAPSCDFQHSSLNPANRIDSLVPRANPTWTLDGIDRDGQRFFAVPTFVIGGVPLRIDVCIPPLSEHPPHLRNLLKSEAALYAGSKAAALRLPIAQHVLRALEHWSSQIPDFETLYMSMPFGSLVHLANLATSLDDVSIDLVSQYDTEQAMLTVPELQAMWSSSVPASAWPPMVELNDLCFQEQLHESTCVVRAPLHHGAVEVVFKSLLRDQRHLYHELKVLLTLTPHPHVTGRPLGIVVHRCRFGSKRGVCGFLLPYYSLGTLAGVSGAPIKDKLRWAKQIASAMMHLNLHPGGFYPDLRPDNVVLSLKNGGEANAVLLDLEQRGGWFSWSPPEVTYLEYMEVLATRLGDTALREAFAQQLKRCVPGWTPSGEKDTYRNVDGGFSATWRELEKHRREGTPLCDILEKAQVFMLGKMLWCMFEGEQFVRCGLDHDVLQDNICSPAAPLAFPEFCETTSELRLLIHSCTLGAPEWEGRRRNLILRSNKMVSAEAAFKGEVSTPRDVIETTRDWWKEELRHAHAFMQEMEHYRGGEGTTQPTWRLLEHVRARPSIADVLSELGRIEGQYSA